MSDWSPRAKEWYDTVTQMLHAIRNDTSIKLLERERLLFDLQDKADTLSDECADEDDTG